MYGAVRALLLWLVYLKQTMRLHTAHLRDSGMLALRTTADLSDNYHKGAYIGNARRAECVCVCVGGVELSCIRLFINHPISLQA